VLYSQFRSEINWVLDDNSLKHIKLFAVIMKSRVDRHLHVQVMMDEINSGACFFLLLSHEYSTLLALLFPLLL
jgi:hypothetical protein